MLGQVVSEPAAPRHLITASVACSGGFCWLWWLVGAGKVVRPWLPLLAPARRVSEPPALFPQRFAADIISVLAMTMSGERECLKYRLVGSQEELASWGHEYVR